MHDRYVHRESDAIAAGIAERKAELVWLRFLDQHLRVLEPMQDRIALDVLWDRAPSDSGAVLRLVYTGKAKTQTEARADLRELRRLLNCKTLSHHYNIGGEHFNTVHKWYEGKCRIGGRTLVLRLEVSWLPDGCRVVQDSQYSRQYERRAVPTPVRITCDRR